MSETEEYSNELHLEREHERNHTRLASLRAAAHDKIFDLGHNFPLETLAASSEVTLSTALEHRAR